MAITTDHWELHGWPRSTWENGVFDGERKLLVPWGDRATFLGELDTYPNNQWPYADGPSGAYARKARITPFSGAPASPSSLASYDWSVIQVWYSTDGPQWDSSLGAMIQENLYPASQYSVVSRAKLKWKSDGRALSANDEPRLDDTLYEYVVRLSGISHLPSWVTTYPGVCNSNVVSTKILQTSAGFIGFPVETLKYNGCVAEATYAMGTTAKYEVVAKFLYKKSGWNKFWRPDGGTGAGGWETLQTAEGDDYVQHTPVSISL